MELLWLREKDSNLHLRVQSPKCCRLHHPAAIQTKCFGALGRKPEPCAYLALTPLIRRLLYLLNLCPVKMVAAEIVEPVVPRLSIECSAVELRRDIWLTRRGS